jgi:hypothetical protein
MPPPLSEFDREMRALEAEIKRLEAEYNMFFAGRLPRLPWERKARVETLMRTYDRTESRSTADRFRFQTMQARFVKFLELWDRQLRDREEGGRAKPKRGRAKAAPVAEIAPAETSAPGEPPIQTPVAPVETPVAPPAETHVAPPAETPVAARRRERPAHPPAPQAPPAERELHVMSFDAKGAEADRVKELYERLAEAKRQVGEAPLALDRISALVNAQLKKHGNAEDVAFRIAVKDGKVSLTVKPKE